MFSLKDGENDQMKVIVVMIDDEDHIDHIEPLQHVHDLLCIQKNSGPFAC